MSKRRRGRGFTLIELLVVVMVVVILASMAVVRYANVRDKARITAATYDLDCLRKFLAYYSTDYDRFPESASSYDDLKSQLVDREGRPYGRLPLSNCYTWLSYDCERIGGGYTVHVLVSDRQHTVLTATPAGIWPETP